MERLIEELKSIANEIETRELSMVQEVREGGAQADEGFKKAMYAVHKLHAYLQQLPTKLNRMADQLEKDGNEKL